MGEIRAFDVMSYFLSIDRLLPGRHAVTEFIALNESIHQNDLF